MDVIIIVIIAFSALRGFCSGLILSVTKLLGFIVGLLVAFKFYRAFADYLIVVWNLDQKLLLLFKPVLNIWLPLKTSSTLYFTGDSALGLNIVHGLIGIIAFVLLLIVVDISIKIFGKILNSLFDWGIFAPVNRLGGLIFGTLRGALLVLILFAVLLPLQVSTSVFGGEMALTKAINDSFLGSFFWQIINQADLKLI